MDGDLPVVEVHVLPLEGLELARADAEIHGYGDKAPPAELDRRARYELRELARVQEALRLLAPAVGPLDVSARIVLANAELRELRAAGVLEHLRRDRPSVERRLPR